MVAWWERVNGRQLAQGDLLTDCLLPVFTELQLGSVATLTDGDLQRARLIVLTQSCDLANGKAPFVALCPLFRLVEFAKINPNFACQRAWEEVRKGRVEGHHLLASPEHPADNRESFVVQFGQVVSLPLAYLSNHAESLEHRWRLQSPFLEHFSQAFARFFMRVGLPTGISPFK